MSIYFPEADVAIEVIPEPEGLPEADCGSGTVRIYVREDHVDSDALAEALSDLIHGRERRLGREESGVGSEAADLRAHDFLSGQDTWVEHRFAKHAYGEADGGERGSSGCEEKDGCEKKDSGDVAVAGGRATGREAQGSARVAAGAPEAGRRDAQELMEDLLDAQEELADALSELTGQMLISPAADPDPLGGGDDAYGDGFGAADDLGGYDLWLQDRLDELCCARLSSMRRPGREINIGSCKNLYIGV